MAKTNAERQRDFRRRQADRIADLDATYARKLEACTAHLRARVAELEAAEAARQVPEGTCPVPCGTRLNNAGYCSKQGHGYQGGPR
jgi:hypothetical protein